MVVHSGSETAEIAKRKANPYFPNLQFFVVLFSIIEEHPQVSPSSDLLLLLYNSYMR